MEERYKEVKLLKLTRIPMSEKVVVAEKFDRDMALIQYEERCIGYFYSFEEAIDALRSHVETDKDTFVYEILGPEHGVVDEERSDESYEFVFIYDKQKNLVSNYRYREPSPEVKNMVMAGDIAWAKELIFVGDNEFNLLIPVEVLRKDDGVSRSTHHVLNIEIESMIVKPLLTLKCNWGEDPQTPEYSIPKIELLPMFLTNE